jgi:hypothetical protein
VQLGHPKGYSYRQSRETDFFLREANMMSAARFWMAAGGPQGRNPTRVTHRVAVELEVEEHSDHPPPEDWELQDLASALDSGVARPLRTVRGLVVDAEHDRLSATLAAVADDFAETTQLQWLATAAPWPVIAPSLVAARPSLEMLVELDQLAALTRRVAARLRQEGL